MLVKLVKTLLFTICVAIMQVNVAVATQTTHHDTKKLIVKTAHKLGVDPYLALSIAKIESNFNSNVKSPAGAIGLYQLTPSTAKVLGVNPYVASENIEGGLKYYQMLYKRYGSLELALAAYNAGPGNVNKYNGVPPFTSTKTFIQNIKKEYASFKVDDTTKVIVSDTL